MWQRFTERARQCVFYAQEEAGKLGHNFVSTEHLLLGLLRDSTSVSRRILDGMRVDLDGIRSETNRLAARGVGRTSLNVPLMPRSKRVLHLAYKEARTLNNNYIGTEHLLLGLIAEEQGLAARVLRQYGVSLEPTRAEIMRVQSSGSVPGNSMQDGVN